MLSRSVAFVTWALVAGTGVFWGMRLFVQPTQQPSQVVTTGMASLARGDVSRLLGSNTVAQASSEAPSATPEFGGRLRLAGVAAPRAPGDAGLAIISVDGNPPRVYRVGALIDTNMVLHDVSWRTATVALAHGGRDPGLEVVLEMPPLAAAQTGLLPPAAFPGAHGAPPTMPGQQPGTGPDGRDDLSGMEPPGAGVFSRGPRAR